MKGLKTEEQPKSLEEIFPEGYEIVKVKINYIKLKNMKKVNRNNMIYYSSREQFDFSIFKIINLLVMIFIAANYNTRN